MQIIVTGHGNFATGIESTVHLLAGKINNVSYIDFTAGMSEEDLGAKFKEQAAKDKSTVFFCDLLGGTPYKQAATLQATQPDADIAVVCGCNVASLMENGLMGLDNFKSAHDLADKIITTAKAGIREFGVKPQASKPAASEPDDEEDGI